MGKLIKMQIDSGTDLELHASVINSLYGSLIFLFLDNTNEQNKNMNNKYSILCIL